MWPLTDGNHCLRNAEADLFRGAVGMMVDQLVIQVNEEFEGREEMPEWDEDEPGTVESSSANLTAAATPHLFTMWEPSQQIWLLERVTTSLLSTRPAPPTSAVFEATIEAIYAEVGELISLEICEGDSIQPTSWRQTLLNAFVQRCPRDSLLEAMQFEVTAMDPCLPPGLAKKLQSFQEGSESENETHDHADQVARPNDWFAWWAMIINRLVDATFGPRLHSSLEPLLDGDPQLVSQWLQSKGVNAKFHRRIPPLRSAGQTQATIDRLQAIIFTD